ncbi:MAG: hypothetical protein NTX97_02405 [Bacteroidetes bacterium]|nr:hypothetical protein [Bacteroidota bacterium]
MKNTNKIIFVLGLSIFSYTLIRACLLSFTWDESFSFLQYVRNETLFPDKYEAMDANNHLLNTWLNIYLVKVFGVSEFVLRLPALFAHLLFLVFSFKLLKNFQSSSLLIASFLIINLNPYLLDFFSLSRGYALSLGLMMASIYYLYLFIANEYKTKDALKAIALGGLAASANFVMLNYFVVSFGLMGILMLTDFMPKEDKKWLKLFASLGLQMLVFSLFLLFLLPIVLKLKEADALYYGGNKGFWSDTFSTITDRCFYDIGYNYWFQRLAKGFVILIALAASVFVGMKHAKKQINKSNSFLGTLVLLLGFCVLSTIVQHYVLGTLYLIERTAIFLVVLFNLLFVFFINEFSKEKKKVVFISYLAAVIVGVHFLIAFNLSYVLEWKQDADIKEMISDLDKIKVIPKDKCNISIAIPLEFDQGINFYRAKDNRYWINTVQLSNWKDTRYDYLFFSPEEFSKINMDSVDIIKRYPGTNSVLAKWKKHADLTKVSFLQDLNYGDTKEKAYLIDGKVEYAQGFNYIINDSITADKNAEVVFKATVMGTDVLKSNLFMIVSFENSKGLYEWRRACVKDYIVKSDEWTDICYSVLVPKECKSGDVLKSYIWNRYKHILYVKKMEFKWLNK